MCKAPFESCSPLKFCSDTLFQITNSSQVNAQVFEIASKLEETPLLGSPTLRDPSVPLPEPPVQEQDSFEGAKPYTDEDINEVISDYEQVGSVYEEASEHVENIYENITEEPVYENIYEKVDDEIQGEIEEEPMNEPHYQTLEEVREEVSASVEPAPAPPSPPQQVASKPPPVIEPPEVLDVTWTDGPSQAAPPCVPPPPPPPDDDSDDDASDQPQGLPEQAEDEPFTRENSTRRIKKELWRRRSDFLGTSSQYIEEEPTVKPPPDLSELLRQEREAERIMAESQRARTPIQETLSKAEIARREREIIESLERSEQLKQQQQQQSQYTWQEHMAEETTMTEEQKQLSEHLEYQVLMSVDRDSCPQGFSSVPPPPPSPVANPTHPCSSLAACMPSHSDLFTLSPLPEGDEVSGSASPHRVICSSPPPLPIAPPECGVPSLTPIPEGEEMATPSTTISEKSTPTSDVVTPSPSSPLAKISACTSANSISPESVPCADSPRIISPELTVTPSQDIAPSPVSSSSAPSEHVNTGESVDQTAPTLSSVSDPIYTSYSSVTSTTYSLVDPNLQTDVNIQQPSESSPSVDEKEGAEVLQHSDNVSCDSVIANDTLESVLEASPSCGPCSSSPQPSANSTTSHAHPDAEPSPSSPNSHLNSPGLLDPSEKPTAPDTQHITEPVNSDSQTVSSAPTVSALQSEKKSEKSSKEKTVRFNIDDECKLCDQSISDSSDDSLPLPSELDSDASIDSKETVDTVVTDTQMKCEEEHVENHTNITSSTLSPSQAQTESTSSESDIDIKVATNVPVTSANIPTTPQSTMDTKVPETMETSSQSPDETFEALPISSKDTVDSVETKAIK
ncbi:uncharacterized protein LOC134768246 isoform X4 [Penaeus indicus]|uniref:uncharacterized protein LOC134768246 isoform X4 n=1 Tax=Penaeus indicus TaxID=29960 RepID=UPI00300D75DE